VYCLPRDVFVVNTFRYVLYHRVCAELCYVMIGGLAASWCIYINLYTVSQKN